MPANSLDRPRIVIPPASLAGLWWMFLRIACTSFGGYMAMISIVRHAVVERRKLMSDQDVLDGIALASALPGPMAINVVAYVGYRLRGTAGALVCVCAAVLPSFALMLALSIAYFRWGQMPAVAKVFMGLMPAVTAVMAAAAWNMGHAALTGHRETMLAVIAAAVLLYVDSVYITFAIVVGAGLFGWRWFAMQTSLDANRAESTSEKKAGAGSSASHLSLKLLLLAGLPQLIDSLTTVDPDILVRIFVAFASVSLFLFGGAYVFVPVLEQSIVNGYGWVTQREFADAIAMGQLMPGPAIISVVFIGFKTAGMTGAVAAVAGIFLPSTAITLYCTRWLNRLKTSANVAAALRGVRSASVGMIVAAAVSIGRTAPTSWISAVLFLIVFIALLRYRIDAVWLVLPAGLIGFFIY